MFICAPSTSCPPPLVSIAQKTKHQCPTQLSGLVPLLLRDLPEYANRATQRRRNIKDANYSIYVAAGQPESSPIAITNPEYTPVRPAEAPAQLFISTLEKQYLNRQIINSQSFHWLFLSYSPPGKWHLALIYSRLGKNSQDPLLLPPINSSNAPIGEAVQNWLRDCRAGKIRA